MKTLLVAILLASLAAVASPAHAASSALCTGSGSLTVSPGLTLLTPGQDAYSTNGYTATLSCLGSVHGHAITGRAPVKNDGTMNKATCAQGTGEGRFVAQFPTDGGVITVSGEYTFQYLGAVGTISATSGSALFSGTLQILPQTGDCVLTPVTQIAALVQGTLTT